MTKLAHLSIKGRVQGVGYRAFVELEAELRGLEGWVRNRRDGSVEAVVRGDERAIDDLCWRHAARDRRPRRSFQSM
jgi:acylphosphatase